MYAKDIWMAHSIAIWQKKQNKKPHSLGPHTIEQGPQASCKPAWQGLHCNTTRIPDAVVSLTKPGAVRHEVDQQPTTSATQEASAVCIWHHGHGSLGQTHHLESLSLNSNPGRLLQAWVPELRNWPLS